LTKVVRKNGLLLFVFLASFLTRVIYLNVDSFWPDESIYLWVSQNPIQRFKYVVEWSAYLPTLLIAIFPNYLWARIVISIFSTFGVLFTYLLCKEILDEKYALLTSLLLSVSPVYWFISTRILLDTPLVAEVVGTAYFLLMYHKKKKEIYGACAGIVASAALLTKIAGLFAILLVFSYALYRKRFYRWLLIPSLTTAFVLIMNYSFFSGPLPHTPGEYMKGYIMTGDAFYYLRNLSLYTSMYLIPLLCLGFLFSALNFKKFHNLLLLSFLLVYFLFFSFLIGEKVPRYILPSLPFMFILCAYGASKLDFGINPFLIFLLFSIPSLLSLSNNFLSLMNSKSQTYSGFPEAGEWLRLNMGEDAILYAGSTRSMLAFTGLNESKVKGLPENLSEIPRQGNVFVEVDVWEYTQPSYVYPLDQEKYNNLTSLGFGLVYYVQRELNGKLVPVIFIFKYLGT